MFAWRWELQLLDTATRRQSKLVCNYDVCVVDRSAWLVSKQELSSITLSRRHDAAVDIHRWTDLLQRRGSAHASLEEYCHQSGSVSRANRSGHALWYGHWQLTVLLHDLYAPAAIWKRHLVVKIRPAIKIFTLILMVFVVTFASVANWYKCMNILKLLTLL